jgi:4'-phosphopantetheinyl transferase
MRLACRPRQTPAECAVTQPIFLFDAHDQSACDAGVRVWILDLDGPDYRRSPGTGGGDDPGAGPHSAAASASERQAVGQQLAREILAGYLNVRPAEVAFLRDDHGRPRLSPETQALSPRAATLDLNWADSENMFVLGLSATGRIGVDVEMIRDAVDLAALLPEHCSSHERAQIAALPASERLTGFFKCWTAKEAVAKLLGDGIAGGLARIETRFDAAGSLHIVRVLDAGAFSSRWPLTHRTIQLGGDRAIVAVVHRC